MAEVNKELEKFVTNPVYRAKVIDKLHAQEDKEYNARVKNANKVVNDLYKARTNEINRIEKSRWIALPGSVMVNPTEGKIKVNGNTFLFSDIQGAELNAIGGSRVETTDKGKSRKHASVGGAVVGGVLLGPVGAVAGGVGLGKTTHKGKSNANEIPTCGHLGVFVQIGGSAQEIVFIKRTVDQTSAAFAKAYENAMNLIAQVNKYAKVPVPKDYLLPSEEKSVLQIAERLEKANESLAYEKESTPTYRLPAMYKSEEYADLSDSEYLEKLKELDQERLSENERQKLEEAEARKSLKESKRLAAKERALNGEGSTKALNIIYNVVFWAASVFFLFCCLGAFSNSYIACAIVSLIAAVGVNPLINKLINKSVYFPRWTSIIILVVGFILFMITIPTA